VKRQSQSRKRHVGFVEVMPRLSPRQATNACRVRHVRVTTRSRVLLRGRRHR
jgi:hypothetical protein